MVKPLNSLFFTSLLFMPRFGRTIRRARPRTGRLAIEYSRDPFRIEPDRSLTTGIPTHDDLVRQAQNLRDQGILVVPPAPIHMQSFELGSAEYTTPSTGWFDQSISIPLHSGYPPGYVYYAFVMTWSGQSGASTNLRVTDSAGGQVSFSAAIGKPAVYFIFYVNGQDFAIEDRGTFCIAYRSPSAPSAAADCRYLSVTDGRTVVLTPYFAQIGTVVTCTLYALMASF
jgi:hypothetical protein